MYTITLNGNSSDLSCNFFPPIEVTRDANICLLGLPTNNSIPNINYKCNQLAVVRKDNHKLTGDYTVQAFEKTKICLLGVHAVNSDTELNTQCNRTDVEQNNNQVIVDNYTLPTGSYELDEIETIIKHVLPDNITFTLKANNNTLKCEMFCSKDIDFFVPNSIANLLGFKNKVYAANVKHQSDMLVNISKVNFIYI